MKTVRISQDQYDQIKLYAFTNNITIQAVVEHAISKLMEKNQIDACEIEIDMFHPHAQKLADLELTKLMSKL